MNLSEFLKDSASRTPDRPALRFGDKSLTFAEMNERVDALAAGLVNLGLEPKDRCVLMMPNSVNWVLAYYAIARLGAVVVPVNPTYKQGELRHIFSDSGARAFIAHSDNLDEPAS